MTGEVQEFVEMCVRDHPLSGRVLEVGSMDMCGSPRRWFTKDGLQKEPTERFPEYIGVDRNPGTLVDLVMDAHDLEFPDASFDVVVSTEMLEHDPAFWVSVREMSRVLRPGGYMILTSVGWRGCGPHLDHDYWRFLLEGMRELVVTNGMEVVAEAEIINNVCILGRKL